MLEAVGIGDLHNASIVLSHGGVMGNPIPQSEFLRRVKEKHGKSLCVSSYSSIEDWVRVRCKNGHIWKTRAYILANGYGCIKCYRQAIINKHEKRLRKISNITILSKFTGIENKIRCICDKHKLKFWGRPKGLEAGKTGCQKCIAEKVQQNRSSGLRFTPEEYKQLVKKKSKGKLVVLGKYIGFGKKIKHKCNVCRYTREASPNSVLQHLGCPICGHKKAAKSFSYKRIQIGNRSVQVQGSEQEAIEYLLEEGYSPSEILVFSEGKVPIIRYPFKGKERKYYPDILIGKKNIIEVKSVWYCGVREKKFFEQNKQKVLAVLKAGFNFKMLVTRIQGQDVVEIPASWFLTSHKKFQKRFKKEVGVNKNGF